MVAAFTSETGILRQMLALYREYFGGLPVRVVAETTRG